MLESLVALDGLTEIPNRRRFDEVLDKEWKRSRRNSSPLSLLMIDIDFFKAFNDHYGHAAGDECLRKVAHTLKNSVERASDVIARYGGEEFAAGLPETNRESAEIVAERMRTNVEQLNIPHASSPISDHVTLSLGAATTVPSEGVLPNDLINVADEFLYKAKERGRNQVRCTLFILT